MIEEKRQIYEFDEFRLDALRRLLTRQNELVPLFPKAFDLLLALVQNCGRDLTKDELLELVWPGQILEESNLSVHISAVRRALGERATRARYIVTIPGLGYRFIGDVREVRAERDELVIESETIAQITVQEETDDDEAIAAAMPVKLIANGEPAPLLIHPQASVKLLAAAPAQSSFKRKLLLIAVLVVFAVIILTATHFVRRYQHERIMARFTGVKVTLVTNHGRVGTAAISPDGKLFAFMEKGIGPDQGKNGLYLSQINGEKTIELVPPVAAVIRGVEYASDGNSVFFSRQDYGQTDVALYRISALGGLPTKLHENVNPYFTIAPDDRRAAFVRDDETKKTSSVLISNFESAAETALVTLPLERSLGRSVSWSPDGSMIALAANAKANEPNTAIFVAQIATGELKPLTAPLWRNLTRVLWLKDGSGLLLIAAGAETQDTRQVWFVAYPSGEAHRITNDPSLYDWGLSVPIDPKRFLLVQLKQFNNLWVEPADDFSKAKQVTFATFNISAGNFVFDWLPNNRIVYASSEGRGLNLNLWTMDADGGNVKELTPPGHYDSYPSATVNGRFIVFSSRRSGADEVWRVDSEGGNPKQLTTCGRNSQPAVSPDGKWVVYVSSCNGARSLWRISIEGGEPVRLTEKGASWPWFSPDSKWVACGYESRPD